ncbi:hypothetical protein GCM10023317_42010 [Actinopolymorpha pittospori]|jgi:hypothetical protein
MCAGSTQVAAEVCAISYSEERIGSGIAREDCRTCAGDGWLDGVLSLV